MTAIMKVLQKSEPFYVDSQKAASGKLAKCFITLQEIGGKFTNSYLAAMLGDEAVKSIKKDDLVAVSLRFRVTEYQNQSYQEVTVNEIQKIN